MSQTQEKIPHVVVVGAGIAGLTTAYLIIEIGRDMGRQVKVTVLESESYIGGNTRTDCVEGYVCEHGPNGFLDNEPITLDLVKKLGLSDRLVVASSASNRRYIYHGGKIREVPKTPLAFVFSDILPPAAKFRMAMEFFINSRKDGQDETIYSFGQRRLGENFAIYILDPMVSGIFAGNIHELSLAATFPKMAEMEKQYGGLLKALLTKKREAKKTGGKIGSPTGPNAKLCTFQNGMGELTSTLASKLAENIRTCAPVKRVEKNQSGFVVATDKDLFETDAVVLACPSHSLAGIIDYMSPDKTSKIAEIPFAPVDVVCQGYSAEKIKRPLDGFGVLIPRAEKMRALGSLWCDSIFPVQAPKGKRLLRTIIGGAHDPEVTKLSDEKLQQIAFQDNKLVLNITGEPDFSRVFRHKKGIAQYTVGHLDRVLASQRLEQDFQGLFFVGASYRNVSVNGCVKDAFRTAHRFWETQK